MELKHVLTNLLPRLSKARLQQFLDQLLQPKVTNVNPLAQRMTTLQNKLKTNFIASNCLDMSASSLHENV